MFKSLREKLQGVSKQIEDELEAQLEAELEAELAASLEKDLQKAAEPIPEPEPAATSEPTPEPAPQSAAAPATAPAAGEKATALQPTTPTFRPSGEAEAPEPTSRPAAPEPASVPKPVTEPTSKPPAEAVPSTPPAPVRPEAPSPAPATTPPEAAASRPAAPAPAPAPPAKPKAPQPAGQKFGRKVLSAEEIEARLARELSEAVEVQKEVEAVVKQTGARVTRYTINEQVLDDILWELEVALLESDVALPVIEAIKENVKEQLLSMSVSAGNPGDVVEKVLRTAIRRVLNVNPIDFDAFVREKLASGKQPVVIMFVGVNGTGKTTSIARLGYRLREQGISAVLAAGDTFRAGAIEQLSQHGDKLGLKVIKHGSGADPAAVAYDAIEHAKARNKQVVLLDTAGRMQTNTNLMDEMDKIRRVAKPDLVVFVGDSLAGNDAVEQARKFDEVVDIDGVILTKVDVDAKGGAALSVAYTINKPLLFVGVGQGYPDLKPFDSHWMVDRLFADDDAAVAS